MPLRRGRNGGVLRSGNPGNSGGRPSKDFRDAMADLADGAARNAYMRRCLAGKLGFRAYFAALSYCSERAWGKPIQPVPGQDSEPTNCKVTVVYE